MPTPQDLEPTPRRVLNIFYVLDTSGSMTGTPIATLNRAMEETVQVLQDQAVSNADAQLKIGVLEFNSGCKWLQPNGPEDMEDFIWQDMSAGGLTDMGAALNELDDKLSRHAFLKSMTGAYLPVIIFMTDGFPTDDYKKALAKINENKWFRRAAKIGFAIGDNADTQMIANIVGNSEAVIRTSDLELFARLLRFVSVTSSTLASQSRTSTEALSGADIVKSAMEEGVIEEKDVDHNIKVEVTSNDAHAVASEDDNWDDDSDWE
ncbi:MAG: VWA domain-containing protein [Bilifractor sp.]